jgi:vacuolar protein sorting-associated protein 35
MSEREVDPEILLDELQTRSSQAGMLMKKALESNNLREAIQYADEMLTELRDPRILPKLYYILFMQIFNDLKELEDHFMERKKAGRKMAELYESVQQASGVLQRLYLMATAGSVYIEAKEASAKEVLSDLTEMAKEMQHPVRGLFFRYYLLKKMKDKLPDKGSRFEGDGGDLNDCINFLLQNLNEMNRLWIRMQYGVRDKSLRESERQDVNMLVGESITRLSDLKGIDIKFYKSTLQPKLFEIVHNCNDPISQQYLMDSIIQVFTAEFHLATLEKLLEATTSLHSSVDVKSLLITLMNRLASYASTDGEEMKKADKEINIFGMFNKYIDKVLEEQGLTIEPKKLVELEIAYMRFCIKLYPNNLDYVNQILDLCVRTFQPLSSKSITEGCLKSVVALLIIPLDSLSMEILTLPNYSTLTGYLTPSMLKTLAKKIIMSLVTAMRPIRTLELVQQLVGFVKHLYSSPITEKEMNEDAYEFEEVQTFAAKLPHLIDCQDPAIDFQGIVMLKETFDKGGMHVLRYTTPAIVNAVYNLIDKASKMFNSTTLESKLSLLKIYQFVYQAIDAIEQSFPNSAIRHFLQGVLSMNQVVSPGTDIEELGYQFASQALVLFQDELTDTESKFQALSLIICTLERTTFFSVDNFETLVINTVQYCIKLTRRQDQCRTLLMCTNLFCCTLLVYYFITFRETMRDWRSI